MKFLFSQIGQDIDQKTLCRECEISNNLENDFQNLVLARLKNLMVVLNKNPYNAGHILIIPRTHSSSPLDLDNEEKKTIFSQIERCLKILEKNCRPEGFNVGFNLKKAGGAANPEHFFIEIVPRWTGDANFMASCAQTKPISSNLIELYQILKGSFENEQ